MSSNTIIFSFFILTLYSRFSEAQIEDCTDNPKISINRSNVTISAGSKCCYKNDSDNDFVYTSGEILYPNIFPALSIKCFSYRVKVRNQTHIGLFSNNNVPISNPWIQIVIGGEPGGFGNIIRKNGVDIASTYQQRQNSLNNFEYRGFWISWVGGNYRVGFRGRSPFMTWQDPNPFQIIAVGVDTCCGIIGTVIGEKPECPGLNVF